MPINPEAVGLEGEPVRRSWNSKDALLYALGVGAGTDELAFTTENTQNTPQQVLPTFAVIIGGVFVMEALSVILQVGSFKLRGKRIFAMAPIHHHFELRGWHESQVIIRFWILSIILAMAGLGLLKVL